jgi:hypothetical protein
VSKKTLPQDGLDLRMFAYLAEEKMYGKSYDEPAPRTISSDPEGMNLVSSLTRFGDHEPVLDLDVPHLYVPSSTPGHAHLFINKRMDQEQYGTILRALQRAGVLEAGYVNRFLDDGQTFVRLPGTAHVKNSV